jgi:sensor histidine kinase regulating citrate/malate metabolism
MNREITHYLDLFQNLDNPIYYSIIFVILIYFLLNVVFKYIILPLKQKHLLEKKELENDNLKMFEIFAEYNPNPIIRIDETGEIKSLNKLARDLFYASENNSKNIKDLMPDININIKKEILNNSNIQINESIKGRHYSINFYGMRSLNRAYIYFMDLLKEPIRKT